MDGISGLNRKGKKQETQKWHIEFRDALQITRRLPAFTSKAASEEMGRNLVKLVEYHKGSGGQTDPQLITWLAGLPARTRDKPSVSICCNSSRRQRRNH